MNWDQSFSVSALCEGCDISPRYIQYTWSLYLVNASSKPVIEGKKKEELLLLFHLQERLLTFILFCSVQVPFCYTVDLSAPSAIMEGPATSPQTPETSTLHPPATDAVNTAALVSPIESASEIRARNLNVTDGGALSKNNREESAMDGV